MRCHSRVEYVSEDTWLSVECEMSCHVIRELWLHKLIEIPCPSAMPPCIVDIFLNFQFISHYMVCLGIKPSLPLIICSRGIEDGSFIIT